MYYFTLEPLIMYNTSSLSIAMKTFGITIYRTITNNQWKYTQSVKSAMTHAWSRRTHKPCTADSSPSRNIVTVSACMQIEDHILHIQGYRAALNWVIRLSHIKNTAYPDNSIHIHINVHHGPHKWRSVSSQVHVMQKHYICMYMHRYHGCQFNHHAPPSYAVTTTHTVKVERCGYVWVLMCTLS